MWSFHFHIAFSTLWFCYSAFTWWIFWFWSSWNFWSKIWINCLYMSSHFPVARLYMRWCERDQNGTFGAVIHGRRHVFQWRSKVVSINRPLVQLIHRFHSIINRKENYSKKSTKLIERHQNRPCNTNNIQEWK